MSESDQEESVNKLNISFRSPTFSKQEVQTLVNLVEKFQYFILNRSTNSKSNYDKEVAWTKITKSFNEEGFTHTRSAECLKTKWDNLKKDARKHAKNLMDGSHTSGSLINSNNVLNRILFMMNECAKNDSNAENLEATDSSEMNLKDGKHKSETYWDEDDKMTELSEDGDSDNARLSRSLNFSPQECSLLLKCVRSEKQHLFSKENSGQAVKFKNSAWTRITNSFNKLSSQKRTTKTLRTKFRNMKQLTKNINLRNVQYNKIKHEARKKIKTEPAFECAADDVDNNSFESDNDIESVCNNNKPDVEMPDPLSTVLNGDSGVDLNNQFGFWNQSQDKEVIKLKLELLKYQLETAKLERKRLQNLYDAEKAEYETKAIESSLRLRAARLAVVAAEAKLPPGHSALDYQPNETKAKYYLAKSGSKDHNIGNGE